MPPSDQHPTLPDEASVAAWNAAPWTERDLELYGLRSALDGGMIFCGVTEEQFAINGRRYQWPRNIGKLTFGITFGQLGSLSDLDCKGALIDCFAEISAVVALDFEYNPNGKTANIVLTKADLDGSSGVLADMRIPVGNVSQNTQLPGRFDASEAWGLYEDVPPRGKIDFYRTALHELLHAMGLGHQPSSDDRPALIAPAYNVRIRNLQPADVEELQRRYPKREVQPPKPPAPTPIPGSPPVDCELILRQGGKEWLLSAQAMRVK